MLRLLDTYRLWRVTKLLYEYSKHSKYCDIPEPLNSYEEFKSMCIVKMTEDKIFCEYIPKQEILNIPVAVYIGTDEEISEYAKKRLKENEKLAIGHVVSEIEHKKEAVEKLKQELLELQKHVFEYWSTGEMKKLERGFWF